MPGVSDSQQCGLFLRACNGDAEIFILVSLTAEGAGRCGNRVQNCLDVSCRERRGFDSIPTDWRFSRGHQLHRADAVAPDRLEELEGFGGSKAIPSAHSL